MSTRSTIGLLQGDGSIQAIYCHFDGYPDGVGEKLKSHYMELAKILELLDLGHLSVLGEEIGEKQDFNAPKEGMCLAYGRDRGESDNEATCSSTISSWLATYDDCDYAYLYENAEWMVFRRKVDGIQHVDIGRHKVTIISGWVNQCGKLVSETKTITIP
jgi:hypothetical protein